MFGLVWADFLNSAVVVFPCIVGGFTFLHLVGLLDGIDNCPFSNLPRGAQELLFRGGELAGSINSGLESVGDGL